jgi:hypothetical protein
MSLIDIISDHMNGFEFATIIMRKLVMEYSEGLTDYLQYLGKKMYLHIVLNAARGGMDRELLG